jgi:hypothetical protein
MYRYITTVQCYFWEKKSPCPKIELNPLQAGDLHELHHRNTAVHHSTTGIRGQMDRSETFNLRLTKRARFALEYVRLTRGLTRTDITISAIEAAARTIQVEGKSFDDYWDECDGVRWLRVFKVRSFPLEERHERYKSFAAVHAPFFYDANFEPNRHHCEVLWSTNAIIDAYVLLFDQTKRTDFYAAGRKMADDLKAAGLPPPQWPPS